MASEGGAVHTTASWSFDGKSGNIKMKIGYVCTNYNNSAFTRMAVNSLTANSGHSYCIVVVDNNSNLDDIQALEVWSKGIPSVHVIKNPANTGYFGGLNAGIIFFKEKHPEIEWLIIGNNDLSFPEGFSDTLALNASRLSQYAVISPDVVTLDGQHQNPHVRSGISWIREVFYDLYYSNYYLGLAILWLAKKLSAYTDRPDEQQWDIPQFIYQGHGSCYLLGPLFFKYFDALWAPTFLMGEEFFLSRQLSAQGMRIFYDPVISVVHHCHGSVGNLPSRQRWKFAQDAHRVYRKYVKVFW